MGWLIGNVSELCINFPLAWAFLFGLILGVSLGWLARTKPMEGDVVDDLIRYQVFYEKLRFALYQVNRMTGDEKITSYIREVQKETRRGRSI